LEVKGRGKHGDVSEIVACGSQTAATFVAALFGFAAS